MTLEECYIKFNGDYNLAVRQLGAERLVERFLLKFPDDPTMDSLREAVKGTPAEAFTYAHTLKGIAVNLALKGLAEDVSELTEQLRPKTEPADMALYEKVEKSYTLIIDSINEYLREKEV